MLLHQLDGWETDAAPWKPCHSVSGRACGRYGDRISCMLVYRSMGDRKDRLAIPLISLDGGLVIRPEVNRVLCVFGGDGASLNNNCDPPGIHDGCIPGCGTNPEWCSKSRPLLANNCRCGLFNCNGRPRPWRASDAGFVMEQHEKYGPDYSEPGFHSGYNEVVLESRRWEANLPQAVQAFFFIRGASDEAAIRRAHANFLAEYSLAAQEVPLLQLDPGRWDDPFELVQG